jgi:hypothetical protein
MTQITQQTSQTGPSLLRTSVIHQLVISAIPILQQRGARDKSRSIIRLGRAIAGFGILLGMEQPPPIPQAMNVPVQLRASDLPCVEFSIGNSLSQAVEVVKRSYALLIAATGIVLGWQIVSGGVQQLLMLVGLNIDPTAATIVSGLWQFAAAIFIGWPLNCCVGYAAAAARGGV